MNDERLLNLVSALVTSVSDRLRAAMEDAAGVGGEGAAAILTVGTRPDHSIDDLRRALGLSHSGAVRLVDRLAAGGWVRRERPARGRHVLLRLTEDGERRFHDLLDRRRQVLTEVLATLPPSARPGFEAALEQLLTGLPSDRQDAWNICRLCEHSVCESAACPVGSAVE